MDKKIKIISREEFLSKTQRPKYNYYAHRTVKFITSKRLKRSKTFEVSNLNTIAKVVTSQLLKPFSNEKIYKRQIRQFQKDKEKIYKLLLLFSKDYKYSYGCRGIASALKISHTEAQKLLNILITQKIINKIKDHKFIKVGHFKNKNACYCIDLEILKWINNTEFILNKKYQNNYHNKVFHMKNFIILYVNSQFKKLIDDQEKRESNNPEKQYYDEYDDYIRKKEEEWKEQQEKLKEER